MKFLLTAFATAFFLIFSPDSFAQSELYQSPCSELIWYDEFDGEELDDTKWTPQIGDGCPGLCGWGNNELQYYTDREENVKVEDGRLIITAHKEDFGGRGYTSARLRTVHKGDFTFGRIVASIKQPEGAGSWTAFWLLPTDNVYGGWAASGEVDIMEFMGHSPRMVAGTIHYGGGWPNNLYKGSVYHLPVGQFFYEDFHEYAIEWDSTEIRWYVDNHHYATRTKEEIAPSRWPFDQEFYIIINNAIGGNLGHTPNDSYFPMVMEVEYVRVYSSPLNRKIHGRAKVLEESLESYHIASDASDVSYEWAVTEGAEILEGQGTNQIVVQWGDTPGEVSLHLVRDCDDFDLEMPVEVYADDCNLLYTRLGSNQNIDLKYSTGNTTLIITNPSPDDVNNAAQVARYTRSNNEKDSLAFGNLIPQDYADFESGDRSFYLDVYSSAKPGTKIEMQLRNSEKILEGLNGTRSTFHAFTSVQDKWETLKFDLAAINDPEMASTEVDEFTFFFDPEFVNDGPIANRRFFLDNFRRGKVASVTIEGNTSVACYGQGQVYSVVPSEGSTYAWSVPAGASIVSGQGSEEITVNWNETSGNIHLIELNSEGCEDIAGQLLVTLEGCPTSLIPAGKAAVSIFPNPAADVLHLESNLPEGRFAIVNSTGLEVLAGKLSAGGAALDISSLSEGIYIVKIYSGSELMHYKFAKVR